LPSSDDGGLGRIALQLRRTQPHRVYATVEAKKGAGVYRSDDSGESWSLVNSDRRIGGRGPGAMGIAVAPDNPDVIYVANTTTWKSSDAGKTFVGFRGAPGGDDYQRHLDQQRASANDCDFPVISAGRVNHGEWWDLMEHLV